LLAHSRWFSPGTPASSTTKTGHHDIAEILLKVALKRTPANKVIIVSFSFRVLYIQALQYMENLYLKNTKLK
jgi:hypothetical protein